jgi:hypothetical protein
LGITCPGVDFPSFAYLFTGLGFPQLKMKSSMVNNGQISPIRVVCTEHAFCKDFSTKLPPYRFTLIRQLTLILFFGRADSVGQGIDP